MPSSSSPTFFFDRSIYDLFVEFGLTIQEVATELIAMQREPLSAQTFRDAQRILLGRPDRKLHVGALLILVARVYLFVFVAS